MPTSTVAPPPRSFTNGVAADLGLPSSSVAITVEPGSVLVTVTAAIDNSTQRSAVVSRVDDYENDPGNAFARAVAVRRHPRRRRGAITPCDSQPVVLLLL